MFDAWTLNGPLPRGVSYRLCSCSCYIIYNPHTIKSYINLGYLKLYVSEDGIAPKNVKTSITLKSGNQTLNLSLME